MTAVTDTTADEQLGSLRAVVDGLLGAELSGLSRGELLGTVRELETETRRLAAVQHRLVAEVAARNVAGELRYRDTAGLLSVLLRLTRRQAAERVTAAEQLGPRRSMLGAVLAPELPATAAALSHGTISAAHTAVIGGLVNALPGPVRAEHAGTAEALLAEHATGMDTSQLRLAAERILATLHPDGTLTPDRVHAKDRDLSLHRQPDGSGRLQARLSPACLAVWQTLLEPLARRRPTDGCGPDERTPGQRAHDGLEEAGLRLLRTADLPSTAGVPTTVLISMSLDQLETRAGQATTHHGGTLSINEALRLAADGQTLPVILNHAGGILAYGRARRLASPGQRHALIARDRGCTFPSCRQTAAQSEVHHLLDWAKHGATDIDNQALACRYHNNYAPQQGWNAIMIQGVPHWIPPPEHDPEQTPQRNRIHRS